MVNPQKHIVKYFIAFKERTPDNLIDNLNDQEKYKIIIPPPQHFYADPFVYKHFLFYEDFDSYKGCIGCIDLRDISLTPKVVLSRPYHLSYPYVFEYENELYMIPETCTEKEIQLFKFSDGWTFCKTLIKNIIAPDVSVTIKDDGVFLFTCSSDYNYALVYHGNTLFDKYTLIHKHRNPKQETRGAGKIFKYQNNFYRPVQIIKPYYGYGTALYRIDEISRDCYKETRVLEFDIGWFPQNKGTHTLCVDENYIAIDALIHVPISCVSHATQSQTWKQQTARSSKFIYTDNCGVVTDEETSSSFLKSLEKVYLGTDNREKRR